MMLEPFIKTIIQKEEDQESKKMLLMLYEAYLGKYEDVDLNLVVSYIKEASGAIIELQEKDEQGNLISLEKNVNKVAKELVLYTLDKFYFDNPIIPDQINNYFKEDYFDETFDDFMALTEMVQDDAEEALMSGDTERYQRIISFDIEMDIIKSWVDTYDSLVRVVKENDQSEAFEFKDFVESYRASEGVTTKNIGLSYRPAIDAFEKWKAKKHYVDDNMVTEKKLD